VPPVVYLTCVSNIPSGFPGRIDTVFSFWLTTARSSRPSRSKSPAATVCGLEPVARLALLSRKVWAAAAGARGPNRPARLNPMPRRSCSAPLAAFRFHESCPCSHDRHEVRCHLTMTSGDCFGASRPPRSREATKPCKQIRLSSAPPLPIRLHASQQPGLTAKKRTHLVPASPERPF
jgi:hypothetical protein